MSRYLLKTFNLVKIAVILILVVRTFIIEPGIVDGRSMEPTFIDNDFFLVNKITLLLRTPHRGDIVQAEGVDHASVIIKRVIGLPGETVSLDHTGVNITEPNGKKFHLDEPYLAKDTITTTTDDKPTVFTTVPSDSYFLMGDNRPMSVDSRVSGSFHRKSIYGLVINVPFFNHHN